ncbi:MAG: DUF1015 family protein [bacterium]|nr:DUF1015 family protein [bacterium]
MSVIKPFRALRPPSDLAEKVACVPYDVPYDAEVREYIADNQNSFLRVTRPEAEFPVGSNPSDTDVLAKSKENLEKFISEGWLQQDDEPSIHLYRLSVGDQVQTGIVATCSIDEYDAGLIKKHEKTRPDKVKDRTDHMVGLRAQTGLIFLAFRGTDETRRIIAEETSREPLFECPCDEGGVSQTVWKVSDVDGLVAAFAEVPALYVADGHHRAESASLARKTLKTQNPDHTGEEPYNFVMAGVFPAEDLKILPYNRAVKDLNGLTKEQFLESVSHAFSIDSTNEKSPKHGRSFAMYLDGEWSRLTHIVENIQQANPIESLDVSLLQQNILAPVLGIDDPRTSDRISFVGGIRGTDELERLVDSGDYAVAFSMYPTSMDDLFAVSDMGEIMPPKSTWFEPKLKDGLFVHLI